MDFGDRANAKLINPKLRLERQPATWLIEGERGELNPDRNEVFLSKTSSRIVSKMEKTPGASAEKR